MVVDLDSEQAPQLLQALSAELSTLVTSPSTPPGLSATCFNIMAQLTSALANLSGAFQRQVGIADKTHMQHMLAGACSMTGSWAQVSHLPAHKQHATHVCCS